MNAMSTQEIRLSAAARTALRSAITEHANWNAYRKSNDLSLATMSRLDYIKAATDLGIDVLAVANSATSDKAQAAADVFNDDVLPSTRIDALPVQAGDYSTDDVLALNKADHARTAAKLKSDADTRAFIDTQIAKHDASIPELPLPVPAHDLDRLDKICAIIDPEISYSGIYGTAVAAINAAKRLEKELADKAANPDVIDSLTAVLTAPALDFVPPSWAKEFGDYLAIHATVALVGPAGNGKTTGARKLLERAGFTVYEFDCTDATMPHDIIGRTALRSENGSTVSVWTEGPLARAFADPKGALLLNEYDALDPRTGMALQSALEAAATRRVTAPDSGLQIKSVGPCPIVLTMNTTGHGASVQYAGRNALDGANRDRIEVIMTGYEHEKEILEAHGYSPETAQRLADYAARARIQLASMNSREIFSNRRLLTGAALIERRHYTLPQAMKIAFVDRLPERERATFAHAV